MQKRLDRLEDCAGMGVVGCYSRFSSANRARSFNSSYLSVTESYEGILNVTPRPSHHSRSSVHLGQGAHDQNSLIFLETWGRSSTTSYDSLETPLPKPTEELIEEIAALELEVINLERYLLSLYRTAFDQHQASSPALRDHVSKSPVTCQDLFLLEDARCHMDQAKPIDSHLLSPCDFPSVDKMCQSNRLQYFEEKKDFEFHDTGNWPARDLASTSPAHDLADSDNKHCPQRKKSNKNVNLSMTSSLPHDSVPDLAELSGLSKAASHHRSLADHLGTSFMDQVLVNPCRLSEDIIRCVSAIYCKLSSSPTPLIGLFASPISSLSSSTTLSRLDPCDNWSPKCPYEATESPCQLNVLNDKDDPYSGMTVVPKLCVDDERFNYAAAMLNRYRTLIRQLETVDPRKMEHNEKLAFWINVHNALVMHAFLAYGLDQDHMKSTPSIFKASYIIGSHSINAHVIQTSIFGCQPHRPELSLKTLLLPAMKFMARSGKHIYAIDNLEPLVHFALCLGAYSDPAVRVYRAKCVIQELEQARDEFIRANIKIHKESRVILPKILQYYSRDASLNLAAIWEMVFKCMTENQKKAIQGLNIRQDNKCIQWSSYNSSFRYIIQ